MFATGTDIPEMGRLGIGTIPPWRTQPAAVRTIGGRVRCGALQPKRWHACSTRQQLHHLFGCVVRYEEALLTAFECDLLVVMATPLLVRSQ